MEQLIITLIVAVVGSTGLWSLVSTIITKRTEKKSSTSKALKAILSDKLQYVCSKAIKNGFISIDEYKNVEVLYEAYVDLNGNGFIKHLKEEVDELPFKKGE